jgi:uncharacterized iron-regulated membrane protein
LQAVELDRDISDRGTGGGLRRWLQWGSKRNYLIQAVQTPGIPQPFALERKGVAPAQAATFWTAPRKTRLRRWIFQIHFYAGLILGLIWTVIGLTGSLIVFLPELRRLEVPGWTRVVPTGDPLPLETLFKRFQQERPTDTPVRIDFDFKPGWAINFGSTAANGDPIHTFIDPYRGTVLASLNYKHRLLEEIYQLHSDLLEGRTGRTVNGWFAMLLILAFSSGLLLWWHGRRYWKRGLEYRFKASWKRQIWDLHNLVGLVFYFPLLVISLTGVYYGYPEQTKSLLAFVTRGPFPEIPPPRLAVSAGPKPRLNDMLVEAQRAIPDSTLSIILFPKTRRDPFTYRMLRSSDLHRLGLNWIYLDPDKARVLRVDRFDQQPLGVQIFRVLAPFHYGHFYGVIPRILWVFAGIVPSVLFVTALLLWWNRSISKKWARARRSRRLQRPPFVNV